MLVQHCVYFNLPILKVESKPFTGLNWDFVLIFNRQKDQPRSLADLYIQYSPLEKTTRRKSGKMTYAASGQPGNLRVNGIQPETKHNAVMTVMMIGAVFVSLKNNNAEPS